jgi:hypothetical protein
MLQAPYWYYSSSCQQKHLQGKSASVGVENNTCDTQFGFCILNGDRGKDNAFYVLTLIMHNAMKTYVISGGTAPPFLTSEPEPDGGDWSASGPGHFTLGGVPPEPFWSIDKI